MLDNQSVLKLVGHGCRFIYGRAANIVVLSPGFKRKLVERGVAADRIEIIYNWCDEQNIQRERVDSGLAAEAELAGRFNIVFAGTMGKAQALDAVIDAAKLVALRQAEVQFVFIGGGIEVERLKGRVAAEGVGNCLFLPRRPVAEIGSILGLADVLLVHLRDDPLFRITIPSKTQAYMAAGKPILMAVQGDAAELVKSADAGICCAPESPEEIAEAVLAFYAMPQDDRIRLGKNGQICYERELSLRAGVDRFEELFHETACRK
jgi:glycosyltransferase involved in cell wall biosynthesis